MPVTVDDFADEVESAEDFDSNGATTAPWYRRRPA